MGDALPLPDGGPGLRISLLVYHQTDTRVVTLAEGQSLVIGRDAQADLSLDDQALSRRHASFELVEGEIWVEDLGSTNGTRVNGELITRVRLGVGDEARLGGAVASIHVLSSEPRSQGLNSHDQLLLLLEHETVRARAFGRPLSLLMLRAASIGAHVEAIRRSLRPVDRLALYSDDVLEILLPEQGAEATGKLAAELQRALLAIQVPVAIGAASFPEAGASADALLDACREAVRRARAIEPAVIKGADGVSPGLEQDGPGLVVRSPAMQELVETVERLSSSLIPVLLIGDTGSGKEVLARLLHQTSPRCNRRLASVNCGAIPATLVESVLFGHEKGAFTGATQSQKGLFEDADGGTVLLDEVGELSPSAQAALLRVLESKELTRVGSNRVVRVDVRVIAATNRDLEVMCREERFRWDLYYRLNAMTLRIPPLRERPEEIAPLAERFVWEANQANGRNVLGIDAEAMRLLHGYGWPGNVRELRNAIERAVVIARADSITARDLPQAVREACGRTDRRDPRPVSGELAPHPDLDYQQQMQREEARVILRALEQSAWNRTQASQLLNMPLRTLSHKIKQLGIKRSGEEG